MTELAIPTLTTIDSEQKWEDYGHSFQARASSLVWDIADWLLVAERKWGERYKRAAEITGLTVATLHNYASVARRFDSSHRYENLSYHHHALVAAIPEEAATSWLDLAESEGWSVRDLDRALRSVRQLPPGEPDVVVTIFKITVPHDHEARWLHAANTRGLSVEDWLVAVADEAAAQDA